MRGVFIVIEGLDGVGKSTVAAMLAARLDAKLVSTPPPSVAEARRLLEPVYESYPLARMLWYASTGAAVSEDVERLVRAGTSVVLARYFLSTLVYARVRGAKVDLAELSDHMLTPDLTVYLFARQAVRAERMRRRKDNSAEDARSIEPDWARKLDAGYRDLASHKLAGRFVALDVSEATPDDVVDRIILTASPSLSDSTITRGRA